MRHNRCKKQLARPKRDKVLEEFEHNLEILPLPKNKSAPKIKLPPKSLCTSNLIFNSLKTNDVQPENTIRKSAHQMCLAKKIKCNHNSTHYYKPNSPDSPISEIEAGLANAIRFLTTDAYVASTRAYYSPTTFKHCGVTSKAIPGYKSNFDKPLRVQDTIIEFTNADIELQRKAVIEIITKLIKTLERPACNFEDSNFSFNFLQFSKNIINRYTNSGAAVNLSEQLHAFLINDRKFEKENIENLLKNIDRRRDHVTIDIKNSAYEEEVNVIDELIAAIKKLQNLSTTYVPHEISIEEFEELSKLYDSKKTRLEEMDENEFIEEEINGVKIVTKVKNLINYRKLRGLGTSLTARYLFKEDDNHNNNMGHGPIIDFDMTKFNITYQFKYTSKDYTDRLLRKPNKDTYIITENDIRNFPNLIDANPYYWPTKESKMKSVIEGLSLVYDIGANLYKSSDIEVYRQLAQNKIFNFYKYKTLLKFILLDPVIFKEIYALHIRDDIIYTDENDNLQKNLLDELIKDDIERIQEVKNVLIKMPEFKKFIKKDGAYAYKQIYEEISQYKTKYNDKLKQKSYYKPLVSAINLTHLNSNFSKLKNDINQEELKYNPFYNKLTSEKTWCKKN